MRTAVPILLCLVFGGLILSISLHKTVIHASFSLNQDYIAENLCIEKDIEGSTCNGHCYLKKQLDQTQESPQSNLVSTPDHLLNLFFDDDLSSVAPILHENCMNNAEYLSPHSSSFPTNIFHPPRV
jgi:hypothetical protein